MNLKSSIIRLLVVCVLLASMAPMALGDTCTVGGTAPNGDTYAGCGSTSNQLTLSNMGIVFGSAFLTLLSVILA